jgi:tether containing UBX domain for GLUT4
MQAVIRVRFPDNHTFEVTFHPSETIQSLVDLLMKVVARPELPFYICMPMGIKLFFFVIVL